VLFVDAGGLLPPLPHAAKQSANDRHTIAHKISFFILPPPLKVKRLLSAWTAGWRRAVLCRSQRAPDAPPLARRRRGAGWNSHQVAEFM